MGIGRTNSGVTMTISSELLRFSTRDRNSLPIIGRSPMPGIFERLSVIRLSNNPPIAKLLPSESSISVLTRRVAKPGMVKP